MKKIAWLTILLLGMTNTVLAQDFYDISTVNTVEIFFTETNWDQILDDYYAAGDDERLIGTVILNGAEYDSVGVRYKGNSSYSPSRTKNPLNIKLDHVIEDQLHQGYGTLKLANAFRDPSFLREVLGYEIARKYTPASLANYINVYINGDLMGLYSSVQSVDKSFLEHHYYNDDGTFIKGDPVGGPGGGASRLEYLGADSTQYYNSYEMKSEYGWQELVDLCDTLSNHTADVENVLNIDRTMWHLAYHNTLVSLDSLVNAPHNYYLYRDGCDWFNLIFWDLNMTFGTFNGISGPGSPPMSVTQLQQFSPYHNIGSASYPVISKLLPNDEYRRIYVAHMKTILEENFVNNWYIDRSLELREIIDEHVQADPNKFYSYNYFLDNLYDSVGYGMGQIIGIVELMAGRITYLTSHSDFTAAAPAITDVASTPESAPAYSTVWITAEVVTADWVYLCHRGSVGDKFFPLAMFDDGAHNDGTAGDGVFGAAVAVGASDLQYFVYAGNADAVSFSPARAAYEFYTTAVAGNLVINEFLASNDTTMADQDGEYDDWVELFNNTADPISLNGFYLSDDPGDLTKWAFPDTTIAGGGYLMIWTDSDPEQAGLHTDFKLSASGESVVLINAELAVIDEITFGTQTTDISTGRYPNGVGQFIAMTPTFAANNVNGIIDDPTDTPEAVSQHLQLLPNYPNPFNPHTTLAFVLPAAGHVRLDLYDARGRRVTQLLNDRLDEGRHSAIWNGCDSAGQPLPSGVYLSRLTSNEATATGRLMLVR